MSKVNEGSQPLALLQIDELMQRFLVSVSFAADETPDYDAIVSLFIPRGLLVKNIAGVTEISSVEEFITPRRELLKSGRLTQFREDESAAVTTVFGAVAQRASKYSKSGTQDGTQFQAKGVIMTQFVEVDGVWLISSMTWDDERSGLTLLDLHQELWGTP